MRWSLLVVGLALLLAPAPARPASASKIYGPGHHPHSGGAQPLKQAGKVEELPGSLEMRVGEKRSFKVGGSAVCGDPAMARISVSGKVMTVQALKEGSTKIFLMSGANSGKPNAEGLKKSRDINFRVTR